MTKFKNWIDENPFAAAAAFAAFGAVLGVLIGLAML